MNTYSVVFVLSRQINKKRYAKTINFLRAGNTVFVKYQAQGAVDPNPPPLGTPLEPSTQQDCWAGSRSRSNFGWLEPELITFRWWSRSLRVGFRIHRDSLWGKRGMQIMQCFTDFWTKLFWSLSQKLLDQLFSIPFEAHTPSRRKNHFCTPCTIWCIVFCINCQRCSHPKKPFSHPQLRTADLDVGARAKKFKCPELGRASEPDIWVPSPRPWYAEDLLASSLLCDVRYSTMEKLSRELLVYCYVTNVTGQQ